MHEEPGFSEKGGKPSLFVEDTITSHFIRYIVTSNVICHEFYFYKAYQFSKTKQFNFMVAVGGIVVMWVHYIKRCS